MKKFIATILAILPMFFVFNQVNAISVSEFSPTIDKKVASMKTTEEKVKFLKSFCDMLAGPNFTQDKDAEAYKKIREYTLNMLGAFEYQLKEEQSKNNSKTKSTSSKNTSSTSSSTTSTSTKTTSSKTTTTTQKTYKSSLPHISDNFSNVNEREVRNAVLSWHNEERKNVWVNSYKYNLDLEWSATTRANQIVSMWKSWNFHARNSSDWYYNYNSILNRFSNLWINFPGSKWAASFSESVWYGSYKCSKSDCTQELIAAIKKTWTNLIMKEKSKNGSHYRAATMKHFTQMWVWIAVDKSNYYVVLHYGVNF